eukprot:6921965-Prymnesium_polylepis.1
MICRVRRSDSVTSFAAFALVRAVSPLRPSAAPLASACSSSSACRSASSCAARPACTLAVSSRSDDASVRPSARWRRTCSIAAS